MPVVVTVHSVVDAAAVVFVIVAVTVQSVVGAAVVVFVPVGVISTVAVTENGVGYYS